MEKIRLGKTNLMVTKLGFGGIPIQRVSEDEAVTVVKRCIELGINFIDTAWGYTTSEERIGKAIVGRREGLILATKSLARDRDGIARHLQQSLKRLGVESIDLYQFHNVSDFDTVVTVKIACRQIWVHRPGRVKLLPPLIVYHISIIIYGSFIQILNLLICKITSN